VRFKIVVPLAEQKSLAAPHNTTNATEATVQKFVLLSMDCRKTKAASKESTQKKEDRQT
jgi:hypothetical protein